MDTDTYGFNFPKCVTEIIIPNGATTISKNVFSTYPNLQTVVIPESVTSIGDYTFYYCSSLTTINYTGTEEQWNAISKGDRWDYATAVNVIYNYKPE